jgi:hypothetical protein
LVHILAGIQRSSQVFLSILFAFCHSLSSSTPVYFHLFSLAGPFCMLLVYHIITISVLATSVCVYHSSLIFFM